MTVYAIQQYRTDTTKYGSEQITKLYQHEAAAMQEAHSRNQEEQTDEYSTTRYRVIKMEVDTTDPFKE